MTVRKRPFTLFYGESTRVQVTEHNYHLRTRATSVVAAIRVSITRMHTLDDCSRVDVYDIDNWHVATIVRRHTHGFEVKFTPWMSKQHFNEVRRLRHGESYTGIY